MGIARLQPGIKYTCSHCGDVITNGEGISINKKPYCESCGLKFLKGFTKIAKKIKKLSTKIEEEIKNEVH